MLVALEVLDTDQMAVAEVSAVLQEYIGPVLKEGGETALGQLPAPQTFLETFW